MVRSHARSHPLVALSLTALVVSGCDSCHASKPYTPYTLTDTPAASGSSAAPPVADAAAAPAFSAIPATPPPGDGARWPLGDAAVEPPAGHAFAQGLVVDVDGDGKPDLLAWARAPDGLRGELIFATSKAPAEARMISALPDGLAASGCTADASLSQIGPRMAAFVFEPRCPGRLRERAARWAAVLRFGVTPEIALELRTAMPSDGEQLAVALDGRDRDGDGRGDVTFTFTLTGAPRPLPGGGSAAASLAYFDRSAGLSRDPTEPETSLKALAASLVSAGRKKTTAPSVPGAALAARRLRAAICDDSGHALISTTAGPVRCGADQLVEQTLISEVEAAYNLADPVTAFAVAARLDALGQRRKDVDGLLAKLAPPVAGTLARATGAVAVSVPASAFAPIAFDESGDLLVRTRDKVIRVDKATFAESTADPQPAWPRDLAFPEGDAPTWRLGAVEDGCDTAVVRASFILDGTPTVLPLPVLTPARCAEGTRAPVNLLGMGAQGYLVAVRGEILAIPAASPPKATLAESFASAGPVPRGAARSPDGGTIAVTTPRGALVAAVKGTGRGVSARLWTGPQIDNAGPCVPANGGARLACVVKEGVAIYDAK